MKKINLGKGTEALVDDKDFKFLSQWRWYREKHCRSFRAVRKFRKNGIGKSISMHRVIMKPKNGIQVDHIDGNQLNNQRSNLRLCTGQQNMCNTPKLRRSWGCRSNYKGVSWCDPKNTGRVKCWRATVRSYQRRLFDGMFLTEIEAAIAYNVNAIKHFGQYARLNNVVPDFT